jgi:hypothetical protein
LLIPFSPAPGVAGLIPPSLIAVNLRSLEKDFIEVQESQSNYYYENYINNNSPLLLKEGWPEYMIINVLQILIPAGVVDVSFQAGYLPLLINFLISFF